jgi:ketosteroid isomerase-like protein
MSPDRDLITQTVRDYYSSWYDGDAGVMERVLHKDLVKRSPDEYDGQTLTRDMMIKATAKGEGTREAEDRRLDVTVHDIYRHIASVTVRAARYHEYLQLQRTGDGWQIINALYALR